MTLLTRPTALLCDFDGTLADTEKTWDYAFDDLITEYGVTPASGDSLGGTADDMVDLLLASGIEAPHNTLKSRYVDLIAKYQESEISVMPGAIETLRKVRGRVPIGVASNSPRRILENALRLSGLIHEIDVHVAEDDVAAGKPSPDLYWWLTEHLGVRPERCVVLEDSPMGARAARAAGCYVIGVNPDPAISIACDLRVSSLCDPVFVNWLDDALGEQNP
ncbi:MAG: HAD family phosphatase [Actinomycetaceae bacterium]|nr:HAD family phosphatase [Actinomycetaceae bacterium]